VAHHRSYGQVVPRAHVRVRAREAFADVPMPPVAGSSVLVAVRG